MVAEFRLEKPNMSYVNVSATGGTTNGKVVMPVPDEEMNDLSSTRSSIRGNILRANDSNLLPKLIGGIPEMRLVVMGGSSVSHDQQQDTYNQQQHYDHDVNFSQSHSPASQSPPAFGSQSSSQTQQPGARHNNNHRHNNVSHGHSQSSEPMNLSFGGASTASDGLSSAASSSSSTNTSNNQPRIRVANLPRATTSFGSYQPNSDYYANSALPRSYSSAEPQFNGASGHQSNNHFDNGLGSHNNQPRVTVIRTTSTYEYTRGSSPPTHPLNSINNNGFHINGSLGHPSPAAGMSYQTEQSVFMGDASQPQPGSHSNEVGGAHRRANRQARQRATVSAAAGSRIGDPDKVVKDLLKSQEFLVKENESLKRKLQLLVSTFNDEQKLNKVLKCLEEKRRSAHTQSVATN